MSKHSHIVFDYSKAPGTLICKNCGAKQVMPEGAVPIGVWIAKQKEFTRIHKNCVNYPMPKGRGFLLQRRATQRH